MKEGEDFYFNEDGLMVFTKAYHLKRGHCCKNKCKHCPWNFGKKKRKKELTESSKISLILAK